MKSSGQRAKTSGERMSWEELCGAFHLNAATIAGWFSTWKISSKIG